MPRAKVKPEERQRSSIACLPCKKAKIRCDAGTPCVTCSKRGREVSCIYQEAPTQQGVRKRARLSSDLSTIGSYKKHRSIDETGPTPESIDDTGVSTPTDESREPQSRILLSSKLQKVYIGATASLSYLQFLRRVVHHRLGACTFTEGDFNNFMLENDLNSGEKGQLDVLEPDERLTLAQIYFNATSGIFDFHTKDEIFGSINDIEPPPGLATISLILAIGAQCRGTSPCDLQHASSYFSHGQQLSFQGMLQDPSVDMVRNFLLMSFYMLGACHRNAAFMYLGVASKAASALGLHRHDQYRDLAPDEFRARLGTWKGLRILDTIVNSILGRSSGLPGALHPDKRLDTLQLPSNGGKQDTRGMAVQAIFSICPFMDELESKVCRQDMPATENFLQRLQKWSKALPKELRTGVDTNALIPSPTDRELVIGGTHVACVYYFAVILTTRRFLTVCLLDRLQEGKVSEQATQRPTIDDKTSSLGQVCVNAAVNLAKVGNNIMISDQMLNNMCLLKAWMFAAGLLLGFSVFAGQNNGSTSEAEAAFHQTRAVLRKISALSLQAAHYYEILTSLSDAIGLYQRKLANEQKQMTSQYLDQIFTSNPNEQAGKVIQASNLDNNLPVDPNMNDLLGAGNDLNYNSSSLDSLLTGPYGMMISEGFPWPADDFAFDWQTYEPFLENTL